MVDVPNWVLVVSGLPAGILTLAGTTFGALIVPRSQQVAAERSAEQQRLELLRSKAEIAFERISHVRAGVRAYMAATKEAIAAGNYEIDAGNLYHDPFFSLKALVSTYFPKAMSVFDDHENRMRPIIALYAESMERAGAGTIQAKKHELAFSKAVVSSIILSIDELEKVLISAVRDLAPPLTGPRPGLFRRFRSVLPRVRRQP